MPGLVSLGRMSHSPVALRSTRRAKKLQEQSMCATSIDSTAMIPHSAQRETRTTPCTAINHPLAYDEIRQMLEASPFRLPGSKLDGFSEHN